MKNIFIAEISGGMHKSGSIAMFTTNGVSEEVLHREWSNILKSVLQGMYEIEKRDDISIQMCQVCKWAYCMRPENGVAAAKIKVRTNKSYQCAKGYKFVQSSMDLIYVETKQGIHVSIIVGRHTRLTRTSDIYCS